MTVVTGGSSSAPRSWRRGVVALTDCLSGVFCGCVRFRTRPDNSPVGISAPSSESCWHWRQCCPLHWRVLVGSKPATAVNAVAARQVSNPSVSVWWEAAKGIWHAGCPDCAIIGLPLVCSLRWFEQVNLLAARRTTCRVLLARKYTILHKAGAASGLGLGDAFVKRVAFFLTFCRPGLYSGPSWGHCCVPGGV